MLKNYFKIAWRNLMKRKFYSLVTIFGLSVGMTFTFLIGSYVWGELQVNSSLKNADNQYILRSNWKEPDMGVDIATIGPLGRVLKEQYPGLVANYYRFDGITVAISKGDKHFREEVQVGDSTLLSMYGFPLLHGDARTALHKNNAIVLTEDKAMKYFGKSDVLGQNLTLNNFVGGQQEFEVTAVVKNLPVNSVTGLLKTPAHIFIPLTGLKGRDGAESWDFPYMLTYIELKPGIDKEQLKMAISQLISRHASESTKANLQVYFTSLKDFYREQNNGLVKKMIYTLSGVALFILLMAIVNFVNITIGNASSRLKEIGVRKVLGSAKMQLIRQFLTESFILSGISMVLALGLYELCRSYFSGMLGREIDTVFSVFNISVALLFAFITGLLAGIYPAFILSGLPAIESVKGKLKSVKENLFLRRLLIASQFTIALFVFICATVISQQVQYFFSKDLGYNKESVVFLATPRDWTPDGLQKMMGVRNQLGRLKEVNEVSLSYEIPNGNFGNNNGVYKVGQDSSSAVYSQILATDESYAETYGLWMLAGKFFTTNNEAAGKEEIVLNESTSKALGFQNPEAAIGQTVKMHYNSQPFTISGVIRDFHFGSMHEPIKPLCIMNVKSTNNYRYMSFKIPGSNVNQSIEAIEKKWKQILPDAPFEFKFMDDSLKQLYQSEIQLQKASKTATILAMVIVLLGILGMVSMNVARRTKELGIRKVLGASVLSIMTLFVKEFLYVMLVAVLISFPLVVLTMHEWLENYAYRIDLDWTIFASIAMIFVVVIMVLVCLQTYKAAMMNPVKAIKLE
jgi:putative ABC transport system permease protein